ncbi:acetylornithine deacetylase [Maliponia aquimaris]|uniref:Acetylornithine deacetylase n=1 Tax=Maliponia aquimaris TaxID=1673631 RepID=A0A238KJ13_9RHOB|nr:acetylornithine deacetylase [Maliponia aquimaris]SMX42687.1 Acetylornithine deacetylase [Maliponia aquimaris]
MDMLHRTEGLLADLIGFPTVSADSNLDLIGWAANLLKGLGARCDITLDETGGKANLFASFGPEGDGGLVLSGHSDVVPVADQEWSSDPFVMDDREGRLYGRGACDMKGFIACVLALAPQMAEWRLSRPLHIALTYDEETGCFGARALVEDLRARDLRPAMAILGEPTMMRVINGHKGCYEYTTHITGCAGHGSTPDMGVNAAVCASRYATRLMELEAELRGRAPDGSPFTPPWTTLNIGRIQSGHAHNVIPDHAEIDWEMRPVQRADADHLLAEIDRFAETLMRPMRAIHPEATIRREVIAETQGLHPVKDSRIAEVVSALTGANGLDVVSFGTEAGLFQSLGMDCVVCGPGSIEQAHKPDEYVSRDQLAACLTMLRGLERHLA